MSRTEPHAGNRGIQTGAAGLPIATPGGIVHPARKDHHNVAGFRSHRPRDVLDAAVALGAGIGVSPKNEVAGKSASTGGTLPCECDPTQSFAAAPLRFVRTRLMLFSRM